MSGTRRPGGAQPLPGETDLVLVDGNNLLHRARGAGDAEGVRWLLPQLRAWRPADVRIVLVLDGHPQPGEPRRQKVVTGIESTYSLGLDADTVLLRIIDDRSYEERARTALVTDDRALGDRARGMGASVRRLDWFLERLASAAASGVVGRPRPSAPAGGGSPARPVTLGAGRAPRNAGGTPGGTPAAEESRTPWKPGRGATRKSGNPRRGHPPA